MKGLFIAGIVCASFGLGVLFAVFIEMCMEKGKSTKIEMDAYCWNLETERRGLQRDCIKAHENKCCGKKDRDL